MNERLRNFNQSIIGKTVNFLGINTCSRFVVIKYLKYQELQCCKIDTVLPIFPFTNLVVLTKLYCVVFGINRFLKEWASGKYNDCDDVILWLYLTLVRCFSEFQFFANHIIFWFCCKIVRKIHTLLSFNL